MNKSVRGQTIVPLVIFVVLCLIFATLSATSYSKIVEHKETLEKKQGEYENAQKELIAKKERIRKIANLVGFYNQDNQVYNIDIMLDDITTKLGEMYISKNLNLDIKKDEKLSFNINIDQNILEQLDAFQISQELRDVFNKNQFPLAPKACVKFRSLEEEKWLIGGIDESKLYVIEKFPDYLSVHVLIDKEQLANNLDYIKNIKGLQEVWTACTKRITYQSEEDEGMGLQPQLVEKKKKLVDLQKDYKDAKAITAKDINTYLATIQKEQTEISNIRKQYELKLRESEKQIQEVQKKRLQAEENVTKLLRKSFYQEREQQTIMDDIKDRIRELQEETAGQMSIEERLDEALAKMDERIEELGKKIKTVTLEEKLEETLVKLGKYATKPKEKVSKIAKAEKPQPVQEPQPTPKPEVSKPKTQESPDGEIVYVDQKSQTAYIDLGRSQGILKGLRFDVLRYGKGGESKKKGEVVVRRVEADMSMVGIVITLNSFDPIAIGDKISNRVYDSNKIRYFVIAGSLEKYSIDEFGHQIEKLGGKIEKEISAKTDFVVLGQGFKEHPIYKRALERGIEMMLESEFLNYLEE